MNEEFEEWYEDNKIQILTEFAINKKLPTDEDTLIEIEEDYEDEIMEIAEDEFADTVDINYTQNTFIRQIDRGIF